MFSGPATPTEIEESFRKYVYPIEPRLRLPQAEGHPYSLGDLIALNGTAQKHLFEALTNQHQISAVRQMWVEEATGADASLTITREGDDFSSRDSALLSAIAPVLRGVLRLYVALERERFAASLTAEAVRRLHFGWITLDRAGHVLDCDEQGAIMLSNSRILSRSTAGRLSATPALLEREIYLALQRVADNPQGRSRAITLSRDPWLDMLLVPANRKTISPLATPAVIAYVHGDSWHSADRCEQLAELFGLSPSEARLALAISRGMTIAEAAVEFGLTTESARTYSKTIYAKTGARGLPDLVRIVMRSVLAIAPDA